MSVQKMRHYLDNGKQNGISQAGKTPRIRALWNNVRMDEWTFTLFLFVLSLATVAGKLFVNYGHTAQWSTNVRDGVLSLPVFHLRVAGEKLMNVSSQCADAVAGSVVGVSQRFSWLVRAAMCGLAMMGFTWFIIYKDSSIPGVNPPSPFSPSKRRYPDKSRLQINYVIGVLNGILIFVYMCL